MSVAENTARIREQIATACHRSGREPASVALMAVTKMNPAQAILDAYACGVRLFGENRVQEFQQKAPEVVHLAEAEFHLIGPLQSNKASRAVELFHAIDSVDSLKLAIRLNGIAETLGRRLPVLLEVKLSHEETKHGIAPAELPQLIEELAALQSLVPTGLMTVPPWSEDPELARPYFAELRRLRDSALPACPTLTQLSMGMSNDFAVAIQEGSTCIRVGTALFGRRISAG